MQDIELASDIMLSLKEKFGEQGRFARQKTRRQIYNTKMADTTRKMPFSNEEFFTDPKSPLTKSYFLWQNNALW